VSGLCVNTAYNFGGPAAAAGNTQKTDCYGLDPNLKGNLQGSYSGIHTRDNITEKEAAADQDKFGKTDIELKFLDIGRGFAFPREEARLLRSQGRTLFQKLEPFTPTVGGKGKGESETNDTVLDEMVPQDYYQILRALAQLAGASRPADFEAQAQIVLSKHGADAGLAKKLAAAAVQIHGKLEDYILGFDLVLRRNNFAEKFCGRYDDLIYQNASDAKEAGIPVFQAFGPEMNGFNGSAFDYPWGRDRVKYILAYRQVVDIDRRAGAKNIIHVFNPHVVRDTEKDFRLYYPGDDYVDIIAFDAYRKNAGSEQSPQKLTENALTTMTDYLKQKGLLPKPYAIGEWGATAAHFKDDFDPMLSFIESHPEIKFSVYYNRKADNGDFRLTGRMIERYRQHLAALRAQNARKASGYNFVGLAKGANHDLKKYQCLLPDAPNPALVIRQIKPAELMTPAKLDQSKVEAFVPGWLPDSDQPPRSLTRDQLYVPEREYLPLTVGHVFDYGTHQSLLSATMIMTELDRQTIKLETIRSLLRDVKEAQFAPFNPHVISGEEFLAAHPELERAQLATPAFAPYLAQPKLFWENVIVLHSVYTQKAIELNDQVMLQEAIDMGDKFQKKLSAQMDYEAKDLLPETFVPFQYRRAALALTLAEAYAQKVDAPVQEYQKGLEAAHKAIKTFQSLGEDSGADYFSIAKGILTAADLHLKIAQQMMLKVNFAGAKKEYREAKVLYDAVAALDYKQGLVDKKAGGLKVATTGIKVSASAQEIMQALKDNETQFYLNHPEFVASAQGTFRFLRGLALLKKAGFYTESPFKPYYQTGYQDVVQYLVYAFSGLREIEQGSPFADLRYFRAQGNLLTAKLVKMFVDSLAYSTSEMCEADALSYYKTAVAHLQRNLPNLLTQEEWKKLTDQLKPNTTNEARVEIEMSTLSTTTHQGKADDVSTPDLMADARKLFRQTFTTHNFRIACAEWSLELADQHLQKASQQIALPKSFNGNVLRDVLREHDDKLRKHVPTLVAEITLGEVDSELRRSKLVEFIKGDKTLRGEQEPKAELIAAQLGKLGQIDELNLPATSYLRLEQSMMRAALILSQDKYHKLEGDAHRGKNLYPATRLLLKNPPDLSANIDDPSYQALQELQALYSRIMAQPEPNKTLLWHQWQTKRSQAYLMLAASIVKSFPGKMDYLEDCSSSVCHEAMGYVKALTGQSGKILGELEYKTAKQSLASTKPLMFDLHEFRTDLYSQFALLNALVLDRPRMHHYLDLAKKENLRTNTSFNVYFRSWILNKFANPVPPNKGTKHGGDIYLPPP
jgi:hypothetical protein